MNGRSGFGFVAYACIPSDGVFCGVLAEKFAVLAEIFAVLTKFFERRAGAKMWCMCKLG